MCNGGPDFREMGRIILYFLAMKMGSDSTRKKKKVKSVTFSEMSAKSSGK